MVNTETINFETESGENITAEVIGEFKAYGQNYIALRDANGGNDEIHLMRYDNVDDEWAKISNLEDDIEYLNAMEVFEHISG